MEGHEKSEFTLGQLFFVTGVSFLGFTAIMKLLDGVVIRPFLDIGLIGLGLGLLVIICQFLNLLWQAWHSPSPQ